jgi:hypothetical protein
MAAKFVEISGKRDQWTEFRDHDVRKLMKFTEDYQFNVAVLI